MRHYQHGEIVGDPDPPPNTSLEQWVRDEMQMALDKAFKAERSGAWRDVAALSARRSAFSDMLWEMRKRGMFDG